MDLEVHFLDNPPFFDNPLLRDHVAYIEDTLRYEHAIFEHMNSISPCAVLNRLLCKSDSSYLRDLSRILDLVLKQVNQPVMYQDILPVAYPWNYTYATNLYENWPLLQESVRICCETKFQSLQLLLLNLADQMNPPAFLLSCLYKVLGDDMYAVLQHANNKKRLLSEREAQIYKWTNWDQLLDNMLQLASFHGLTKSNTGLDSNVWIVSWPGHENLEMKVVDIKLVDDWKDCIQDGDSVQDILQRSLVLTLEWANHRTAFHIEFDAEHWTPMCRDAGVAALSPREDQEAKKGMGQSSYSLNWRIAPTFKHRERLEPIREAQRLVNVCVLTLLEKKIVVPDVLIGIWLDYLWDLSQLLQQDEPQPKQPQHKDKRRLTYGSMRRNTRRQRLIK
jgi:hypothetical protein